MRLRSRLPAMLCVLLATGVVAGKPRSFDLDAGGRLEIDVPDGWTVAKNGKSSEDVPWLTITPPAGRELALELTATALRHDDNDPMRTCRRVVERMAADLADIAVETNPPLKELKGTESRGLYVTVTDKTVEQPTATNFKYEDDGGVVLDGFFLQFKLLMNQPTSAEHAQALDILRSARHRPADAAPNPAR